MIHGNTSGIKRALLWRLEKHLGFTDKTSLVSEETLSIITEFTQETGREVSVFISRSGRVEAISVGDAVKVDALDVGKRRGENSKCKIRVIHTHPKGSAALSAADISALKEMNYDCLAAVGVSNAGARKMQVGYTTPTGVKLKDVEIGTMDNAALLDMIVECDTVGKNKSSVKEEVNNRCLLVGVGDEDSLYELKRLAETANYDPVGRIMQKRTTVDSVYYVGSGKIDEIAMEAQVKDAALVVFDVPLTATQHAAIEERLGRRVIDRGTLILEIFEKHATTAEGRLQVELARLKYTLPLLVGQGTSMSRQRGGLYAMGGSGETKLETDRRHIRKRISELSEKLHALEQGRDLRRRKRKQSGIKSVTLLGYTNAGKSTLINQMSRSDLYAENKLFATLDSVSRSVWSERGSFVLTDTVGFIRNLPHTFVEAFKSTLDEVRYADLLIHVVDASSPEMASQIATVQSVIEEIGASDVPIITVYNKADKAPREEGKFYISAKFGENVDLLKQMIQDALFGKRSKSMIVKVKKLDERATLPTYGSAYAAGADLYALVEGESLTIAAGETVLVRIGLSVEIPEGYVGLIYARRSRHKKGLAPANKVGVIDSDYRGEVKVALFNQSGAAQTILAGERVAQLVIAPYLSVEYREADVLSDTARGEGGFGSTGNK